MSHSNETNLQILYEDNHLLAINKRAGDLVQGDQTGDLPLGEHIKSFIKKRDNKPGAVYLGVPHRLDRPTTGLVVYAKSSKALPRLNKLFAEKQAQKTYWAIVKHAPQNPSGDLIHYLVRNTKQNKSYAHAKPVGDSKLASLSYKTLVKLDNYTLLEIDLHTGRHHQIRAQLAALGSPIKGDLKYGFDRSNADGSISLHARSLAFTHPVQQKPLMIIAPVPKDSLWQAFAQVLQTE